MKYRLELNNISKSFGDVHANKNINLQIKKGEIQALLGDGAGKSTLVKMILTLEQCAGSKKFFIRIFYCFLSIVCKGSVKTLLI